MINSIFPNNPVIPLFKLTQSQLSPFEIIIIFLKISIGTGMISLGSKYTCGLITTTLVSTFVVLVNFYSLFLFVKVSWKTKESSFEDMWDVLFGHATVFIPCFCIVASYGAFLTYYLDFTISIIQQFISDNFPNTNRFLSHQFTLFWLVFLFVLFPSIFLKKLKTTFYICSIGLIFACIILFSSFYWLFQEINVNGFNANNELVLWKFDSSVIQTLVSLSTAYIYFPITYPGLKHIKRLSISNSSWLFGIILIILYIFYSLMGISSYLTLYNRNEGGVFIDYFPKSPVKIVAQISLICLLICTIPLGFNHSRYALISVMSFRDKLIDFDWWVIGFFYICIFSLLLFFQGLLLDIAYYFLDFSSILFLFFFPPIYYLKAYGLKDNYFHTICSFLFIIAGILIFLFQFGYI